MTRCEHRREAEYRWMLRLIDWDIRNKRVPRIVTINGRKGWLTPETRNA